VRRAWCAGDERRCGGFARLGSGKPITARSPRRSAHYLANLASVATSERRDRTVSVGSLCCSLRRRRHKFLENQTGERGCVVL
jgi:hypothetical protein